MIESVVVGQTRGKRGGADRLDPIAGETRVFERG
jgi:hypothetical protein